MRYCISNPEVFVPQFRVEFVLDQVSGNYLAEMYSPENPDELLVRTEAVYPTQAAAVLGVVNIFKNAILKFPPPTSSPRSRPKVRRRRGDRRKAPSSAKARKPPKRRSAPRRSSSAPKGKTSRAKARRRSR